MWETTARHLFLKYIAKPNSYWSEDTSDAYSYQKDIYTIQGNGT